MITGIHMNERMFINSPTIIDVDSQGIPSLTTPLVSSMLTNSKYQQVVTRD